tara:strand:+ start:57 stop:374 length:318 start_codon:yes stop_codon:yes gene_type:complete
MLNQIKPIERPSLVETLITQIQYVPDWKKEDFLNEYSELEDSAKYIVLVYQQCRNIAQSLNVLESIWNAQEGMQFSKRIDFINKVQFKAVEMVDEAITNLSNERR